MNDLQRSAILLSLIEHLRLRGSWCGETQVQKATYFLQELMGVPLDLNFIFYKYGPYSFDLRDEIVAMRADSLLGLIPNHPYGPSLAPGELIDQVKKRCLKTLEKFESQISFVADKLSEKQVSELEALSTALYAYLNEDKETSPAQRVEFFQRIRPHTKTELAIRAVKELDELFLESKKYHYGEIREQAIA